MNPFLAALEILALLAGSIACLALLAIVSGSPLVRRRHTDPRSEIDQSPADGADRAPS